MINENKYVELKDLHVYKLSRELSRIAWRIYGKLNWQNKKIMGDQFIEATDSTGANIAEGYGRYHYLDRVKFYYNARGSLIESCHWFDVLAERDKVELIDRESYKDCYNSLKPSLNKLISSVAKQKYQQ